MRADAILLPVCAQVLLTLLVWVWMYHTRLSAIFKSKIDIQDLANEAKANAILNPVVNPSDNFENLFELPVLFYLVAILVFTTALTDPLYVAMAWVFVLFRALHSLIHCTSNRILYRFATYFIASLVLWAIWVRFAYQLLNQPTIQ